MSAGSPLSAAVVAGATVLAADGVRDYGDRDAEGAALRDDVGVVWLRDWGALLIEGSDHRPFLNRLLTSDVAGQPAGSLRRSLLLDNKGRIQALLELGAAPGCIAALGPRARLVATREALQRFVLAADVRFEFYAGAVLTLVGPRTSALIAARPGDDGGAMTFAASDGSCRMLCDDVGVWEGLLAAGAHPVGVDALEAERIRGGHPAHGSEITGHEFPQELHLETAVDFEKGCYLGQETVARIHYRGQVNRLLAAVRSSHPVDAGAPVYRGGKEVGTVTSGTRRAATDGLLGLALISRDAAAPGTELFDVDGAPMARVVELPEQ